MDFMAQSRDSGRLPPGLAFKMSRRLELSLGSESESLPGQLSHESR
jgi:hypothetical protein